MNKFILLPSLIIFLLGGTVYAQEKSAESSSPKSQSWAHNKLRLNLNAGYTYSNLKANLSNFIDSEYVPLAGFGVATSAEYSIGDVFFASLGLGYLQKNYRFDRTNSHSNWYSNYTNAFLNVPVSLGAYFRKDKPGLWGKIAIGMYGDYWLSRKSKGYYPVFAELNFDANQALYTPSTYLNSTYDFKENQNQLNRTNYGVQAEAQLGYKINKQLDVFAQFDYQLGLRDIHKEYMNKDAKQTLRMYLISVGVSHQF